MLLKYCGTLEASEEFVIVIPALEPEEISMPVPAMR